MLKLNRPPVNALNSELSLDISAALDEAADPAIRALVITGTGKHFAAGADISRFVDFFEGDGEGEVASELFATVVQLEELAKPTIAAITGAALGGGSATRRSAARTLVRRWISASPLFARFALEGG